jgi:outer membrane murein-binding lipoprotein Lpp
MNIFIRYFSAATIAFSSTLLASSDAETKVNSLESRVKSLEAKADEVDSQIDKLSGDARVLTFTANGREFSISIPYEVGIGVLIASFCALWAQNNRRSAWLWFFLGLLFAPIMLFVVLAKNGRLRREERERALSPAPPTLQP